MTIMYHEGNRELQDRFDSRRISDRLEEKLTRTAFTADDKTFIESVIYFFMEILPERPPGNVHAGQKFWISRLPQLHDRMTTTFRCLSKEEKGNRRWLNFGSDTVDAGGRLLFRGQMTTIWAA